MGRSEDPLPPIAWGYGRVRSNHKANAIVHRLYAWMAERNLTDAELQPDHVELIVEKPFGRAVTRKTRYVYRNELLHYLEWLHAKGQVNFDPSELRRDKRRGPPLPPMVQQFVAELALTRRPGTCANYRNNLRRFHRWLNERGFAIKQLNREQITQWLAHQAERAVAPSTRVHTILDTRAYLRWLNERGLLEHPADRLLRADDLPKLPRYLPRPLSPAADRELRARLAASSCRYQQGLLLMRNTGLRIGELIALPYDCMRSDLSANHYLKVPLGKLNNERLVPLDAPTVKLIETLQRDGPAARRWLLESGRGKRTYYRLYWDALKQACKGIDIDGSMSSHRLRHTYATTLLSGGMSLTGIMKLLGHLSSQMTLRYAALTQETIGREYFDALRHLEQRYRQQIQSHTTAPEENPRRLLSDVTRWIAKHVAHERGQQRVARALIKRIRRLDAELQKLMTDA